jgi:tripartite-type tricarboxylate transporter receptor subunit TctC
MGASGGIQGVQYLFNVAPSDGTYIGTSNAGPIAEQKMGMLKVNYDVGKFRWVGSLTTGDTVCAVWRESPIKSLDDARSQDVPMASTGATSAPTRATLMVANLLGVRFRPVPGYDGGTSLLAIERQEVEGSCTTLGSLRTTRPDWIRNGQLRVLVQVSMTKDPEFPEAPRLYDLLTDDEHKKMLEFLLAPYEFNNPIILPPGTGDDALAAWRKAFQAAVTDEQYLAEAATRLQKITPRSGEEVESLVSKMLATPQRTVDLVKAATDIKAQKSR